MMSDNAVISLVIGATTIFITIFGFAIMLAFRLGTNAGRIDKLELDRTEIKDKINLIFTKLESLGGNLPHHCLQIETIASLLARLNYAVERLVEHSQRMDRMQADSALLRAESVKQEAEIQRAKEGKYDS